jgi:hypothetical protein
MSQRDGECSICHEPYFATTAVAVISTLGTRESRCNDQDTSRKILPKEFTPQLREALSVSAITDEDSHRDNVAQHARHPAALG